MAADRRNRSVPVALFGLGRIAYLLERDKLRYHPCTHAGSLRALTKARSGFNLQQACDINPERLQAFGKWWGHPLSLSQESDRAARDCQAKLAIVATSLEAHFPIAKALISSGVPNLLLEKPPAQSATQAETLLKLARQKGTRVWVNFERRYHPNYQFVRRVLETGKYGELRSIRGRVLTGAPSGKDDGGPLLHDAIHWIDLLLWYAGVPKRIVAHQMKATTAATANGRSIGSRKAKTSRDASANVAHTTFATFHYDGFSATLEAGGRRGYFEFQMELDFERGRILIGNEGIRVWKTRPSLRYEKFFELREVKVRVPKRNPWLGLYQEILSAQGKAELEPTANLAEACQAMRIIEQCAAASPGE